MNHYMDIARADPSNLAARAKAEKYAKILAKTIINPDGDAAQYGENAFFYDSAEGLLTAIVLLLAEFAPPKDGEPEKRHIVSAFKLVQDLLAVPKSRGKNGFQLLMDELPPEHKARWLAGAALTSADQSMASVMSTVMSRLNAFLDTELEQVICYDSPINAEMFASEKCAIFLILPEEDPAKNFEQCRRHLEIVDQKVVDGRGEDQFERRARIAVVPFEIDLLVLGNQLRKTLEGLKTLVAGSFYIAGGLHLAGPGEDFHEITGSFADHLESLVGRRFKICLLHRCL